MIDVSYSTGGNLVRSSILCVKACAGRPIWLRTLKSTFSNNSRGPGPGVRDLTYASKIGYEILFQIKAIFFKLSIHQIKTSIMYKMFI